MKRKAHPHEHEAELNIIPYLDIMVNLVMFMLMSMAGFVTFQVINVNMPDLAATATATPPPKSQQDDKHLTLNVSISARGFYIAATGGVLPGETGADAGGKVDPSTAPPTIPCKRAGASLQEPCKTDEYDYDALTLEMAKIKKQYPDTSQYFLAADAKVAYDTVVKTMDATRGDSQHPLFPDVAFAAVE